MTSNASRGFLWIYPSFWSLSLRQGLWRPNGLPQQSWDGDGLVWGGDS